VEMEKQREHYSYRFLIAFLIICIKLAATALPAKAQVTVQANPAFSTPTPAPQAIAPPPKPFKGEVVELELGKPSSDSLPSKESIQSHKDQLIKISDVELDGNRFHSTWVIRRALGGILKHTGEPMSYQQIEDEIKRINKFNNFKLKATIQKTAESDSEGQLHLDVYEQQPIQVTGTFDNQGRPGVGTLRPSVQLTDDSLLGMGDQLKLSYLDTQRDKRAAVDYRLPLDRFGGAFGFHYDFQFLDYGPTIATQNHFNPNLGTSNNYWEGTLEHPLDKNRVWTPYTSLGIRHVVNKSGRNITSDPNNRTLTFGLKFNKIDRFGSSNIDASSTIGMKQLDGDFKFWRVKTVASRVFNLPKKNKITLRSIIQLTPDGLPVPTGMQIGGAYSVRGYTEGLLTGDRGQYYSIEHQWPVPLLSQVSPYLADHVRGVSFFDFGQIRLDRSNVRFVDGVSNRNNRTTLMSAGVGVRAQLTQYAQGFCDFGFGFGNRNNIELNGNPTLRVHFGLRSDFLPKPYKTRPQAAPKKLALQ
jgi:hemolysin activation/secretion protein